MRTSADANGTKAEAFNANYRKAHVADVAEDRAFDGLTVTGMNGHLVVVDVRRGDDQVFGEHNSRGDAAPAVDLDDRGRSLFNRGRDLVRERGPSIHVSTVTIASIGRISQTARGWGKFEGRSEKGEVRREKSEV